MKSDKIHRNSPETIKTVHRNCLPRRWNPRKWLKDEVRAFVSAPSFRERYVVDPERDFTRMRKMELWEIVYMFILMPGHYPSEVLSDFYRDRSSADDEFRAPCIQAYRKALKKLRLRLLMADLTSHLNEEMQEMCPADAGDPDRIFRELFDGYTLYSVDGTDINLPYAPGDPDYHIEDNKLGQRGHNRVHVNCIMRCIDRMWMSMDDRAAHKRDEHDSAFKQILREERNWGDHPLFIFDRGYSSFELILGLLDAKCSFLMRMVDSTRSRAMAKILYEHVPDEERSDEGIWRVHHYVVPSLNAETRKLGASMCRKVPYDGEAWNRWHDKGMEHIPTIEFDITLIRFYLGESRNRNGEMEQTYECLITDLDPCMFSLEEWKALYNIRWGIETSIRSWKYNFSAGRVSFRDRDLNLAGLKASALLYNMTHTVLKMLRKEDLPRSQENRNEAKKHLYRVSEADAARKMYSFLKDERGAPGYLYREIGRKTACLRPNRLQPRYISPKGFKGFCYQAA